MGERANHDDRDMATRRLLTSGELARELSISPRTVARYARDGVLKPAMTTAGGHHRWDLEDVRAQLRAIRERERAKREASEREPG